MPSATWLARLRRQPEVDENSDVPYRASDDVGSVPSSPRAKRRKVDPRQRARIERFYLALGGYGINILVAFACALAGYASVQAVLIALPVIALANGIVYYFHRTGRNLKLRDPSMATGQMLLAIGFTIYAAHIVNEARVLFLMLFLVPYVFATSQFQPRKHLALGMFTVGLYFALIITRWASAPESLDLRLELLELSIFGVVMIWLSFVGHSNKMLRYRAEYDQLTRVRNRQNLLEMIEYETQRAARGGPRFCVALLDLDHFKRINDSLGHSAGDIVLKRFAKTALRSRRQTDIVGRFGGEEFLMLLPDTTLARSILPLERLRGRIAAMDLDDLREGLRVTTSIGVAEHVPGESVAKLIERADQRLYEAKRTGRNRIVFDDR